MTATALTELTGASSSVLPDWNAIQWQKVTMQVRRLQMRIAKAFREGNYGKAKSLQWILTHSFNAKLLAVKRVVQNSGAKTPGVDGVIWKTPSQKMKAALSLKRRGYKPQPLRRIYISKKQKGKLRPLSIPAMKCRAQQALYLLALEPISEIKADKNAYGFRPLRSTADAIQQCFITLAQKNAAQYVLEGDIQTCFDSISHHWLTENVFMDKEILRKWLAAGYVEKGALHPTLIGTPQGSIISPTLLTVTLSGLEQAVKAATVTRDKVNVVIYADDFIITGISREVLENKVKPVVEIFLRERGLSLSQSKTKLTHISEGFDFLGMNVRKYNSKLIIKPAKSGVKRFLANIRETIKLNATVKTESLIYLLNPKIRGFANYYRNVCSKQTFQYIDHFIFKSIWRWAVRRHPAKGAKWVKRKYFRYDKSRHWVFSSKVKNKEEKSFYIDLLEAKQTTIKRHIKIRAEAIPYNPIYHEYLDKRILNRTKDSRTNKCPMWWLHWWNLFNTEKNGKTGLF